MNSCLNAREEMGGAIGREIRSGDGKDCGSGGEVEAAAGHLICNPYCDLVTYARRRDGGGDGYREAEAAAET